MRIAYIGKHTLGVNDDEGAIASALESLGHSVTRVEERDKYYNLLNHNHDFVLLHHHWRGYRQLQRIRLPKAYWSFDLIDHPHHPGRLTAHFRKLQELTDLGFCTDGLWAEQPNTHQLLQGADARITGDYSSPQKQHDILFAGSVIHIPRRQKQLENLKRVFGSSVHAVTHKNAWVYREDFARLIGKSKITIALKEPVTDLYWSNRVYIVQGFAGFLIHPYSAGLAQHYTEDEEIVFYHSEEELHRKIHFYLNNEEERERIRLNALTRTLAEHTYTHRCSRLLSIIKKELS